jgi:hypothetical protein
MEDKKRLNVVDLAQHPEIELKVGDLVRLKGKGLQTGSNFLKLNQPRFEYMWNTDTVFVVKKQLNSQYYILYTDGIEINCYRNFLCKIINITSTH